MMDRAETPWQAMLQLKECMAEKLCVACDIITTPGVAPMLTAPDQAWVRLVNAYPTTRFPAQETSGDSCVRRLAYVFELGVARCIPVRNRTLDVTPENLSALTMQTLQDMEDVREAVQCCLPGWEAILGNWTPIGPNQSVGGFWRLTVSYDIAV